MTRKKTHKGKETMPSVAKKLVVVQSNEQVVEAAPPPSARPEELRLLEALLIAAGEPLDEAMLARRLPNGVNVKTA
jgi:segregation and condensation protein B